MGKREAFSGQENSTCKGLEAGCTRRQTGMMEAEQCGGGGQAGLSWKLP